MKAVALTKALRELDAQGKWLVTRSQLQVLFPEDSAESMKRALTRHVKSGVIHRVAYGLYANPAARSQPAYALESIVSYLRPLSFNYLTAETVLGECSVISQMTQNYLAVGTTGPSSTIETLFGTIEFMGMKEDRRDLERECRWDANRGIYVAKVSKAYADLVNAKRNLDLVDMEELEEQLEEEGDHDE